MPLVPAEAKVLQEVCDQPGIRSDLKSARKADFKERSKPTRKSLFWPSSLGCFGPPDRNVRNGLSFQLPNKKIMPEIGGIG